MDEGREEAILVSAAAPGVSVVIPHYNDLDNLDRCLALLAKQDFGGPFEVIVVDNASAIAIEAIAARIAGRARLISCLERGAGPARNAGIAASSAPLLAFIDSDCRPRPDWLSHGVAALKHWDFVGGQVDVDVKDPENLTPVEAFERVFAFPFKHYIEKKKFSGTGNLFVRRNVFETVGGFKAQVSEDVEWSHRAGAHGFRLAYEPKAMVSHPARRSWDELLRKWRRVNSESFELARTKPFGVALWLARSLVALLAIVPHAVKIMLSPKLARLTDRLAAIGVLIRLRVFRVLSAHRMVLAALVRRGT